MSNILDVKKAAVAFLKKGIEDCENIRVVKLEKKEEQWDAVAEVYEDDTFLKAMNLPTKKTRVFYFVQLNNELEVTAFERMDDEG